MGEKDIGGEKREGGVGDCNRERRRRRGVDEGIEIQE